MNNRLLSTWFAAVLLYSASPGAVAEMGISDSKIRLGMINAQSGPAAQLGQEMEVGARAVFGAVNRTGGIHGRQIELIVRDDGYEPGQAIDETLAAIQKDEVFSLFGSVGTPTTNAILPILRDMSVPLVGIFSGANTLRRPVTREVFNLRASYDDESEAIVEHFVKNGATKVSVFYQEDGFGKAVLAGTKNSLARRGMKIHSIGRFKRNTLAINQGLSAMIKSQPDAIVMVGTYAPLARFMKEARAENIAAQFATVSFVGTAAFIEAAGENGNGVVISQVVPFPKHDNVPAVNECRELVENTGSELGYVSLEACLSAKIMVEALKQSGPVLTRNKLITTLESMKSFDLGGLSISFSPDNHQASSHVYLSRIDQGRVVEVKH